MLTGTVTRYAVLGLLMERPSYPYELHRLFEQRVGPEWGLSPSAIRQAVTRLQDEGLIERVRERRGVEGGAKSYVYRITEPGKTQYHAWYDGNSGKPMPFRDEIFVKIALCTPDTAQNVLEAIGQRERHFRARLERNRERAVELTPAAGSKRMAQLWPSLHAEAVISHDQAALDWLARARAKVEELLA